MRCTGTGFSRIGERGTNEDSWTFANLPSGCLAVVADGLGGQEGGEVASAIATDVMRRSLESSLESDGQVLASAVGEAHGSIRTEQTRRDLPEMMTTVVALLVQGDQAWWAHVGDSRCYLLREGALRLLTEDHTPLGEMVRTGRLQPGDLRHHPMRNMLSRCLGHPDEANLSVPTGTDTVQPGDRFLLCSDGLWEPVDEERMEATARDAATPEEWTGLLEEEVLRLGTPRQDNYTAVVVQME
ncbi:MAG: serine/threonine-protein phosphatase [Synergistales bacterium]|nr:serine/threonine-protein phosphatase [Synergistales bacterium]